MPRYLFIVARGHPEVYADLQRQFVGNPDVEVLVDRRLSERRGRQDAHEPERRRGLTPLPSPPLTVMERCARRVS